MAFILSDSKRYSPTERQLFELLSGPKLAINTNDLAQAMFPRRVNGRTQVNGILKSLVAKTARYREPFRVRKSKRCGPYPITAWVERV